jgi:hypothetical protein
VEVYAIGLHQGGCGGSRPRMSPPASPRSVLFPALAAVFLSGCSADSGTGGQAIRFEMLLASPGGGADGAGSFSTRTGFRVTLSEAYVALGPIYVYENPPPVAAAAPRRSWPGKVWELLVPSAHAHPGDVHFAGGAVKGEFVGQVLFDALAAEPLSLGSVDGIAGPARSFSIELNPPSSEQASAALRASHAYVVGVAEKDDVTYEFEGGLSIDDAGTLRKVEGIPLEVDLREGSQLTIQLHLDTWFQDADFARLQDRSDSGRLLITPTSQVRTAWFIGARSFEAFSASAE